MALLEVVASLPRQGAVALTASKGQGSQTQGLETRGSFLQTPIGVLDFIFVGQAHKSRTAARQDHAGSSCIEASFGPSTSGRHSSSVGWQEPELFVQRSSIRTNGCPSHVSGGRRVLEGGTSLAFLSRSGKENRRTRRALAAVMSLGAGGVNWPVVQLGNQNEDGEGNVSEPLSCLFIGPIEEADKVHLEALYMQVGSDGKL